MNEENQEGGSFLGSVVGFAAKAWLYMKAEDAGRAATNYSRAVKSAIKDEYGAGVKITKDMKKDVLKKGLVKDVGWNVNIPFTQGADTGGFLSIDKAYNGQKISNEMIVNSFKHNNRAYMEQLSVAGFSDDEVNTLKKFANSKNSDSWAKTYTGLDNVTGEKDDLVNSILNSKKTIHEKKTVRRIVRPVEKNTTSSFKYSRFSKPTVNKKKNVAKILSKTDDTGELLIRKVKPNVGQIVNKGFGFVANFTKGSQAALQKGGFLGNASYRAQQVGRLGLKVLGHGLNLWMAYDIAKMSGNLIVNTYKNSDSYKEKEEKHSMARSNLTYEQMSSFNDSVLSARISNDNSINEERVLVSRSIAAGKNVNEYMKVALGGYSDVLSVNKIRKSGR